MPFNSFKELVGEIICTFGNIELTTNALIHSLVKDRVLANTITRLQFKRRVSVLRELMLDRKTRPPAEIKELCDGLCRIADDRNRIAHNPIGTNAHGVPQILVIRDLDDLSKDEELTQADLEKILERARHAFAVFTKRSVKTGRVRVR